MNDAMYALHEQHEDTHWWFAARRRIVLHLLRRVLPSASGRRRILDVGCGVGGMLEHLEEFGDTLGIEPSAEAIGYAEAKGRMNLRRGMLPDALPLADSDRFDVITMLDVLEHVDDDIGSLRTLRRHLRPGGLLLITVPAFPFLWSHHDVVNEHKRRYTLQQLQSRLTDTGFAVDMISYYNTSLFLPIAAVRMIKRVLGRTADSGDLGAVPRTANALLRSVFAAERHVLPFARLPFGVSLIAIGRNPSGGDSGRQQ